MKDLEELKKTFDFLDELEKEDQEEVISGRIRIQNESIENQTYKLTPGQKFIISLLIFLVILILGFFIMLITGKMVIPT